MIFKYVVAKQKKYKNCITSEQGLCFIFPEMYNFDICCGKANKLKIKTVI